MSLSFTSVVVYALLVAITLCYLEMHEPIRYHWRRIALNAAISIAVAPLFGPMILLGLMFGRW